MNLDTLYTANRVDSELRSARLEQIRQVRDGIVTRNGMTTRLGILLIRAGSRLQGLPQAALPEVAIRPPESTHAPA
jgi:hypothetical protein